MGLSLLLVLFPSLGYSSCLLRKDCTSRTLGKNKAINYILPWLRENLFRVYDLLTLVFSKA